LIFAATIPTSSKIKRSVTPTTEIDISNSAPLPYQDTLKKPFFTPVPPFITHLQRLVQNRPPLQQPFIFNLSTKYTKSTKENLQSFTDRNLGVESEVHKAPFVRVFRDFRGQLLNEIKGQFVQPQPLDNNRNLPAIQPSIRLTSDNSTSENDAPRPRNTRKARKRTYNHSPTGTLG
jgi:hypothetical protein